MGAAAPNGNQAMIIAVPFLAFSILFNGLVIQKASAPVYLQWVFQVSPMRYALQPSCYAWERGKRQGHRGDHLHARRVPHPTDPVHEVLAQCTEVTRLRSLARAASLQRGWCPASRSPKAVWAGSRRCATSPPF